MPNLSDAKKKLLRHPDVGRRTTPTATYMGSGRLLIGTRWRTRMIVPADDISLAPELAQHGEYDRWLAAYLRRRLPDAGTFVDVGAHFGTFSILGASIVGKDGTVVAYEPNPSALDFLRRNIYLNYASQVIVAPVAAWSERTNLELIVPKGYTGSTHVNLARDEVWGIEETTLENVAGEPLSDRCHGLTIDVLKIDVEGAELHVLRGAQSLIDDGRVRNIVVEAVPQLLGGDWTHLREWMERMIQNGSRLRLPQGKRGRTSAAEPGQLAERGWSQVVLELS